MMRCIRTRLFSFGNKACTIVLLCGGLMWASATPMVAQDQAAQDQITQDPPPEAAPREVIPARPANLPRTRWEHVQGSRLWTRSVLSSLNSHAQPLTQIVPKDIDGWCPAYPNQNEAGRQAFWVGLISTLAKHESTYRPGAVGGGGLWYGLLQILPDTARRYGCHARSGAALKHGPDNLTCALRIMTRTVARDQVVSAGMRGVAADWGPFHSRTKRTDMMRWTKAQSYCKPLSATRPKTRPALPQEADLSAD